MIPRFGLSCSNELTDEVIRTAVVADELLFDHLWIADHSQYDVFSILTFLASKTQRIKLCSGVTSPYTRHPVILAAGIATVNEISGGRGVLGLGAGGRRALGHQLFTPRNQLLHTREAIEVMKSVLAGNAVKYKGKTVEVKSYLSHIKMKNAPIYLAAAGPKMLRLAGEMTDGVIINGLGAWPPAMKGFLKHVEEGTERAGRELKELDVVCWTRIAMAEEPESLKEMLRPAIGLNIAVQPIDALKEKYGIEPEVANQIKEKFEEIILKWDPLKAPKAQAKAIEELVPDYMLRRYALFGTPEQVVKRIKELMEAGVTQIALRNWPGVDPRSSDRPEDISSLRMRTLKTFGEQVIPAFR
ncbi:LLM class flavin-dependent oxidoreductase [Thermoproteota archaeon]